MNAKKTSADLRKAKPPKKGSGGTTSGNRRSPFHAREVAVFLLFITFLGLGAFGALGRTVDDHIARGVTVGPFHVGGMTRAEAREAIEAGIEGYALSFSAAGLGTYEIPLGTNGAMRIDVDAAIDLAYSYGRTGNAFSSATDLVKAGALGEHITLPFDMTEAQLTASLAAGFPTLVKPAENASFRIRVHEDGSHDTEILPPHDGMSFDADLLLGVVAERVDRLSRESIGVSVGTDVAELDIADVTPLTADVARTLERAPLDVRAADDRWTVSRSVVADWLVPVPGEDGAELSLDELKLREYLSARGAAIATEPRDAVFRMSGDKVVEFAPHKEGRVLDIDASRALLASVLLSSDGITETPLEGVELPVKTVQPDVTLADSNDLGIDGLIGVGESNFRGSPSNRRKNIARGAELMRGVVVAPGEEFSLLATLEPFDGSNGYLPELVIKENKTVPEYGGGLCQIGTTTFRGVLDTGLVVTARQNHSYRVPYYERDGDGNYMGPGTDATIYDPSPDFRFINDTPGHVMIWTRIDGDRLTFQYWGTDDGRKASRSDVSVWNVISPPPTKIVKTTELAPGVKRCTESPHSGSTASFTYTVEYADGRVEEEDFVSVYRPWQEVCLLGVTEEELAAEQAEGEVAGATDDDAALPSADAEGVSGN